VGGNALKNTVTRRYDKKEYVNICYRVQKDLTLAFSDPDPAAPRRKAVSIPAYRSKETFGDLDILMDSTGLTANVRDVLKDIFNPTEIVKNGSVYSFDVDQFQVDLILTPKEELWSSYVYFSYNDLGNLMGRIYHKMGLKYGHEGLVYPVREDSHTIKEILVSRDMSLIFQFGGYSWQRWQEGFDTLEDIFEYTISSPFYSFKIFDLDNRNHRSRVRDRKRPTYTAFLNWAENREGAPDFQWDPDKKIYLQRIREWFPDFGVKYDTAIAENEERKFVHELFNGDSVSRVSGYSGKELGQYMAFLKKDEELMELAKKKPRTEQVEHEFWSRAGHLSADFTDKKNNKGEEDDSITLGRQHTST